MSRSNEWHFRLGPLGMGVRTARVDEAFPDAAGPSSDARPHRELSSVGRSNELAPDDPPAELLVWETEGGNLGEPRGRPP